LEKNNEGYDKKAEINIEENYADKEKTYDILIDLAKIEYDNFFKRTQTIETKVEILLTIIGIVLAYILTITDLKSILNNITPLKTVIFHLYIGEIGCFIALMILTFGIIIPKKTPFLSIELFDKEMINKYKTIEFKKAILLESFKKSLIEQDKILRKKNKKFKAICILNIIIISIAIILNIMKYFIM
jgi:hypothetical protein